MLCPSAQGVTIILSNVVGYVNLNLSCYVRRMSLIMYAALEFSSLVGNQSMTLIFNPVMVFPVSCAGNFCGVTHAESEQFFKYLQHIDRIPCNLPFMPREFDKAFFVAFEHKPP